MSDAGAKAYSDWESLQPPPYLLGATLVFWGVASGHPLLGGLAAVILESHRWIRWRWDFSDQDYVRVWNLCVALFLIVAVFQVTGKQLGRWQVTRAFQQWMPLLLFPMVWAQGFSRRPSVPLITFSLVARRKRVVDERAGRRLKPPRRVPLGYFYFAVLLLSIGAVSREAPSLGEWLKMETRAEWARVRLVYVGVTLVLGWALLALVPRRRWLVGVTLLMLAAFAGHHVHIGLRVLHGFLEHKTLEWITGRYSANAERVRTEFGEVGELKLSPKVFWRARYEENYAKGSGAPTLLPEAVYHAYRNRFWFSKRNYGEPYKRLFRVEERNQWEIANLPVVDSTGAMIIRGRVKPKQILPRLDDTALVYDLEASWLRKSLLGTLEARPNFGTVNYTVYAGELRPGQLEMEARDSVDLDIDAKEAPAVNEAARSLGAPAEASTREKVAAVEAFFSDPANGFRYTKWLRGIGVSDLGTRRTHLSRFLDPKGRAGHCEYFATATVLMLRALEVPARYVVGYALQEFDPETQEFILRGTHRHAWARVWVDEEKRWINVDTTPADWLVHEEKELTNMQRWVDRWDYWMLSWNLWRRDDDKGFLWTFLPLLLAGGLLIAVVLRLVRGLRRSRAERSGCGGRHGDLRILGADSAWFRLEKLLGERGWKRPHSQPTARWCRQLLAEQPDWKAELPPIIDFHYRYRFDPGGVTEEDRRSFESAVESFCHRLTEEAPAQG